MRSDPLGLLVLASDRDYTRFPRLSIPFFEASKSAGTSSVWRSCSAIGNSGSSSCGWICNAVAGVEPPPKVEDAGPSSAPALELSVDLMKDRRQLPQALDPVGDWQSRVGAVGKAQASQACMGRRDLKTKLGNRSLREVKSPRYTDANRECRSSQFKSGARLSQSPTVPAQKPKGVLVCASGVGHERRRQRSRSVGSLPQDSEAQVEFLC